MKQRQKIYKACDENEANKTGLISKAESLKGKIDPQYKTLELVPKGIK